MKKLFFALCMLLGGSLYALPVGNPIEATLFGRENCCEALSFCDFVGYGVGFYGDYVFNRHMETVNHKDIDTTKLFTNAGYLLVNLWHRLDLFTTLGASRLSLNTSLGAFSRADPHPLFEIESLSSFSYSVGARVTVINYKCFSLGIVGQYFSFSPRIKRMYIAAGAVSYPDDVLKTHYHEWQIGTGLSYRFNDFFVPYAAIKFADSRWKLDNGKRFIIESNTTTFLFNLKSKKVCGYAVGLSFLPPACEKLAVTAEARFGDEKALYINGQIRF